MLFIKSFLINKCVKLLNLPPHISTDVGSQLVSHISDSRGWLCLHSMEGDYAYTEFKCFVFAHHNEIPPNVKLEILKF